MGEEDSEIDKRQAYLTKLKEKIFEVVYFCEEQYACRGYMLDTLSPPCENCDNCLRVQTRSVSKVNLMSDVKKW